MKMVKNCPNLFPKEGESNCRATELALAIEAALGGKHKYPKKIFKRKIYKS
jgi:hypothetical protein